jgi:hypothetical protein
VVDSDIVVLGCGITDRASAAGATVLGAPSSGLLHRPLLGAQMERCCGARQLQAHVRLPQKRDGWAPEAHPPVLVAHVVVARRSVVPTGLHAALLETGALNRMGTDRSAPASRSIPCSHELFARHASLVTRSGNPRRRLLMASKGVEGFEFSPMLGHTASWLRCAANLATEGESRQPNEPRLSCGRDGPWRTAGLSASSAAPWRTNGTLSRRPPAPSAG